MMIKITAARITLFPFQPLVKRQALILIHWQITKLYDHFTVGQIIAALFKAFCPVQFHESPQLKLISRISFSIYPLPVITIVHGSGQVILIIKPFSSAVINSRTILFTQAGKSVLGFKNYHYNTNIQLTALILSTLFFTVKIPFRLFYDCFMSVLLSFLHTCEVLMSRVRFLTMITPSLPAAAVTALLQTIWSTACKKRTLRPLQPINSLSTHSIRYHCFIDYFYTQTATFPPPHYPKPPSFQRYDTAMNCPHFTTVFMPAQFT